LKGQVVRAHETQVQIDVERSLTSVHANQFNSISRLTDADPSSVIPCESLGFDKEKAKRSAACLDGDFGHSRPLDRDDWRHAFIFARAGQSRLKTTLLLHKPTQLREGWLGSEVTDKKRKANFEDKRRDGARLNFLW
jgi:hypothetical protein